MKSSKLFAVTAVSTFLQVAAVSAARVDMDDPRRAVGREDDIRVDAQLNDDTVASGQIIGLTYQIQNLTSEPIAVAEKVCSASYDSDSRTITLAVGAEVPKDGLIPKMAIVAPGEKRTFSTGTMLNVVTTSVRSPLGSTPRYVRIKVHILRDLQPFRTLLSQQGSTALALSDEQFDIWLETSETIFLNQLPVRFDVSRSRQMMSAESDRHSMFRGH